SRPLAIASSRAESSSSRSSIAGFRPLARAASISSALAARISSREALMAAAPSRRAWSRCSRGLRASKDAASWAALPSASICAVGCRSSTSSMVMGTSRQDQVVPVNQLFPATVAEQLLDVAAVVADDAPRIRRIVGAETAAHFAAFQVLHDQGIPPLEVALDTLDASRQQGATVS